MLSLLVPFFKWKGHLLNPKFYRGIKFLEHAFKLYKKILHYGFSPGKGTVDAAFVIRRLSGKCTTKNKMLFLIFVDLEKALD